MCTIGGLGRHIGQQSTDISVDYRSIVDRYSTDISTDCRPMHRPICSDQLPVKYRSSIGQVSIKHRSSIGQASVKYRPSIGQVSVKYRFTDWAYRSEENRLRKSAGFFWYMFRFTAPSKITIIKALAVSQIVHVLTSLPTHQGALKEINTLLYDFLWESKGDKIKRTQGLKKIDTVVKAQTPKKTPYSR